jgi:hypothetical protein
MRQPVSSLYWVEGLGGGCQIKPQSNLLHHFFSVLWVDHSVFTEVTFWNSRNTKFIGKLYNFA